MDECRLSACGGDGVVRSIAIVVRSGLRALATLCADKADSGSACGVLLVHVSSLEVEISLSLVGVIDAIW